MLFNSSTFIVVFLPIVLLSFFSLVRLGYRQVAISWLVLSSLFFYSWYNINYLWLILASITINFWIGKRLTTYPSRLILALGICINLGLLGYFKYANFFVDSVNWVAGTTFHLDEILLPLAISFFTFQQIAYLVDTYRGLTQQQGFLYYALFVSFFPQLIAGPIVNHRQVMPQLINPHIFAPKAENFAIGIGIFTIGLFKKVVLADNLAIYADPVFATANQDVTLTFVEAWGGILAYTFQLYFDFSGYSDMAIGLAKLFGVNLPINFASPYKARNIIDFWRRWHITLSKFLQQYLYISLGGNRKGLPRRYLNLMLTMLLGGLWHGAGWAFILWGGIHGVALVLNHAWQNICQRYNFNADYRWAGFLAKLLTFLVVAIAWVPFRAESWPVTEQIWSSAIGMQGVVLPTLAMNWLASLEAWGVGFGTVAHLAVFPVYSALPWLLIAAVVVFFCPNTQTIMSYPQRITGAYAVWRPYASLAVLNGILLVALISLLDRISPFLYFNF